MRTIKLSLLVSIICGAFLIARMPATMGFVEHLLGMPVAAPFAFSTLHLCRIDNILAIHGNGYVLAGYYDVRGQQFLHVVGAVRRAGQTVILDETAGSVAQPAVLDAGILVRDYRVIYTSATSSDALGMIQYARGAMFANRITGSRPLLWRLAGHHLKTGAA